MGGWSSTPDEHQVDIGKHLRQCTYTGYCGVGTSLPCAKTGIKKLKMYTNSVIDYRYWAVSQNSELYNKEFIKFVV